MTEKGHDRRGSGAGRFLMKWADSVFVLNARLPEKGRRSLALKLIILLGLTSLLGSLISNGAHSVTGPFLLSLGGSAAIVGLVAGMGDFIGYALRLFTGIYLRSKRNYWALMVAGYAMLIAIPVLAFAGSWEVAALFIILERVGKAIRAPSRDTILSHATSEIGRGKGFGIHKALDQIGAILGPLVLVAALVSDQGYKAGFALLAIPLIFMFIILFIAHALVPKPARLEPETDNKFKPGFDQKLFVPYSIFIFLVMAGFANFPIISYYLASQSPIQISGIPLLFSLAMLISGAIALIIGPAYDRWGLGIMAIFPVLNILAPLFIFLFGPAGILAGIIVWGAAKGIQETLLRATIADHTGMAERGMAYGIMNAIFGTAWFLGSVVMGVLYEVSVIHLLGFVIIVECLSVPVFIWMKISMRNETAANEPEPSERC